MDTTGTGEMGFKGDAGRDGNSYGDDHEAQQGQQGYAPGSLAGGYAYGVAEVRRRMSYYGDGDGDGGDGGDGDGGGFAPSVFPPFMPPMVGCGRFGCASPPAVPCVMWASPSTPPPST